MRAIINHLMQLQELALIRIEQKSQRQGANLEQLDASISNLAGQLPGEIRSIVTRMQAKDPLFIVPIVNTGCAGCGMKLPISLVQAVRLAEMVHHCPICARLLYWADAAPHHIGKAPRRCEPRKAGIARFSSQALMIPDIAASDRDGAIHELAAKVAAAGFVDDGEKLYQGALRREAIISTALDNGLAFPHVRGVQGGGLTLALGISQKGIPFDADSKTPTRMIFFMVIPTAASAFYLKLLAGLAKTFADADSRKAVMSAGNEEKMWKALLKVTKKTIP